MIEATAGPLEGGCTCRAVRYRMTTRADVRALLPLPLVPARDGASFALNAMIEADRVVLLQGDPEIVIRRPTAARGRRSRAARYAGWRCGATTAAPAIQVRFVRVGTLDEPDRCRPTSTSSPRAKQPWVVLGPDVPAMQEYYDSKMYWPKESLERRAALFS